MSINFKDNAALQTLVSEELGAWSNEILIDQNLINEYAELSGDKMWLHVDVERCKTQSPFQNHHCPRLPVIVCAAKNAVIAGCVNDSDRLQPHDELRFRPFALFVASDGK
jgi:hypothetical protein